MKRLTKYLEGRWLAVMLMILVGTGNAAAQAGGWLIVRNAIDNGIVAKRHALPRGRPSVIYLAVAAAGWVLQAFLIRGLAVDRPGDRDRPPTRPLRPPHGPFAPVLLAAEGGLDHRAPHERRRRRLGHALAGDADARLERHPPARRRRRRCSSLDWRLGLITFVVLPPALIVTRWFQRASHPANVEQRNRIGAVTAQIAESVAGMAVVQAFNRERRFQEEFDELNAANREQATYVQKIFSVFFPSIEFLGVIAMVAVLYSRLAPLRAAGR